jgi:hypothetical protein
VEQAAMTPEQGDDPSTGGSWVGILLYLVVLAAAAALATLTLLPQELLRN